MTRISKHRTNNQQPVIKTLLLLLSFFVISFSSFGQLAATFTNQKDACDGLNNGSIDVTVTGSTGIITVQFFGPPNYMLNPADGVPETISGLNPRTYLVIVQDDDESVGYAVTINNVTPDLSASVNTTSNNTDCNAPNGSITLTVGGGTGSYSYSWTGPAGPYPNSPILSNLPGGTYNVEVFDDGSNCSRVLGPIDLTDPAVIVQTITTPSPLSLCPGTDAIVSLGASEAGKIYEIHINGAASGFTSPGAGGGGPISITVPSGSYADGDVLTIEGYEGICPRYLMAGSVTVDVLVQSVAPTSAVVDNPNYCDDAMPVNITLSYVGGVLGTGATAQWYDDAGFTSSVGSGNLLTIAAPAVTTTYYVRFEGTCNTTTGENVTVTVDNASTAPTSASVDSPNYCDNAAPANITLSYLGGTLGTGATAEWYDDAGFTSSVGSGNNLTLAAPLVTTTYFVRFEGICGNTTAQNVTITVDLASVAPTSAIVDSPSYCDDAAPVNITLSYAGGSLGTAATAEWYDDAGFTSSVGTGNNLTLAAPLVTTTYFVRFEGTCNITAGQNVTVTVDNASIAPTSASVDNPTYCDDAAPANITLSYAGGTLGTGATAEWYDDAGFTSSVGSGNNLNIAAPLSSTTYFVRFEGICGNTSAQNVSVTVDLASVAPTSASVDNPTYCDNAAPANIVLSYSGGSLGTGATARWYDDAGFTSSVGSGNNLSIAAPAVTSTYYVRFEGSCNTTAGQNVTVTVDNASIAPTSANVDNANYCNDAPPANITLSYAGGSLGTAATAEWYDDAAFTNSVGSGNNLTIAAPTATTTYFVRFEGPCNTTTGQNVTVTVDIASVDPASASVNTPTYCDDAIPATITLSYAGGSLGTGAVARWYDDAGFTSTVGSGNNLSIGAPAVTTSYYVRFEGACNTTADQNVTVTVDNASVAPTSASVDNASYCDVSAPANITLSFSGGTLGTGATAEWYDDAGFTSSVGSGNNLTIAAPLVSTTYFVRFEGGCGNTTAQSVAVSVDNASTAPTGASVDNPVYCDDAAPANITLTYSGGSLGVGATAEWYDDAGFTSSVGSGNNLTIPAPAATTTYYIRFEGACTITADQNVTVTVDNASVAPTSATVDSPAYCDDAAPANITLTYAGGTLGTGSTAEWYDDAAFTSSVGSGNNLTLVAPTATTTYFIRFEGGCGITTGQNVTVTVDNASVAPTSATVDNAAYCDDAAPATITLSFVGGNLGTGSTAEWYDDAGFTSSVGSGNNLTIPAPAATTIYYVRFEGACNITADQSVTVTVDNASVAPTAANVDSPLYCENAAPANITLSYTGGNLGTGATAEWYDDAAFTNSVGTGNNLTIAAPAVSTTYFIRFEGGSCGNTTGQSVLVNVATPPDATITPAGPFCTTETAVNLSAATTGGTWSGPGITDANAGTFDPATAGAGTHSITYNITDINGCSSSDNISVIVVDTLADLGDQTQAECQNSPSPTLVATPVPGAIVEWYNGPSASGTLLHTGDTFTPSATDLDMTTPGSTVFTYIQTVGCLTSSDAEFTVNIEPQPNAGTDNSINACISDAPIDLLTQLGGTPDAGGTWTDDDASGALTGSNFDPVVAGLGTYNFTYSVDGSGACTGQTVTAVVTVSVISTSTTPTPDQPTYYGCTYAIAPTMTTPGLNIRWYSDAGLTNQVGSGNSFTPSDALGHIDSTAVGTTTYFVTQDDGCGESSAATVEITLEGGSAEIGEVVNSYPEQNIGAIEVINFQSDYPPYEIRLEDLAGNVIHDWEEVEQDRLGNYTHLFTLLPDGDYLVWVRDANGCMFPLQQSITLETDIFIPNVFTPNGDGYNEAFKVLNVSGPIEIYISNRWGVKVYESSNYQNDWDANNLPEGVYFYTIRMSGQVYKGNVEVWRHDGPGGN